MVNTVESEVEELLPQWEESYKKGLLSFWILFSLTRRAMYAYEMKGEIMKFSQGSIVAEENSIYRALRRFTQAALIAGEVRESSTGPARKYYSLTPLGTELLLQFIERNLLVFQSEAFITSSQTFLKDHKENLND